MNNYFDVDQTKFEQTTEYKNMNTTETGLGYNSTCNMGYMNNGCGTVCPPVHECPQERVCHRYINYEVPHLIPCNTRIINHHIYRHTYTPCYSCCEENVCENVFDGRCC